MNLGRPRSLPHRTLALLLTASIPTACGGGTPSPKPAAHSDGHATIGPEGGTITSADGNASLVIPAGALAERVTIGIEPAPRPSDGDFVESAGPFYRFTPDGLDLAAPAVVTLPYDAARATGPEPAIRVAKVLESGLQLDPPGEIDPLHHRVSAYLLGFSQHGSVMVLSTYAPDPRSYVPPAISAELTQNHYVRVTWPTSRYPVTGIEVRIERARKTSCRFGPDDGSGLEHCLAVNESDYQPMRIVPFASGSYSDPVGQESALYFYRIRYTALQGDGRRISSEASPPAQVFVVGAGLSDLPSMPATGPSRRTLSVRIQGQGTVASSPSGIDCAPSCSASFPSDRRVRLTHTPAPDWHLARWEGDCNIAVDFGVEVLMSADRSCTAVFTLR